MVQSSMAHRAEPRVERDRRGVPVDHRPLHPAVATRHRDAGEVAEQRLAHTAPPGVGHDEQVLEVQARAGP